MHTSPDSMRRRTTCVYVGPMHAKCKAQQNARRNIHTRRGTARYKQVLDDNLYMSTGPTRIMYVAIWYTHKKKVPITTQKVYGKPCIYKDNQTATRENRPDPYMVGKREYERAISPARVGDFFFLTVRHGATRHHHFDTEVRGETQRNGLLIEGTATAQPDPPFFYPEMVWRAHTLRKRRV